MSKPRRKHNSTPRQGTEPQPYTLSDLMRDFQQGPPEPPRPESTNAPGSEDMDTEQYEELQRWPEPGDLTLPPDAGPKQAVATIDVLLLQTELFAERALEDHRRRDEHAMLANLSCIAVNFDQVSQMLDELGQNAGPAQPAQTAHNLLSRFQSVQDTLEELTELYPDIITTASMSPQLDPITMSTMQVSRIQTNLAAMRHCRDRADSSTDTAQRDAYRYLLFDLYHNAEIYADVLEAILAHHDDLETANTRDPNAILDCRTLRQQELERFNQELQTELGPSLAGASDEVLKAADAIMVEPLGHVAEVMQDPQPRHHPGFDQKVQHYYTVIAYHHQGKRRVQGLSDPYPKGFPSARAEQQLTDVAYTLEHPDPAIHEQITDRAMTRADLALFELHCVTQDDMQGIVDAASSHGMTQGAIRELIEASVDYDPATAEELLAMAGMPATSISRSKARSVIAAARKIGLDEHQLAEISYAMDWYEPEKLGVRTPRQPRRTIRAVLRAARRAGFPDDLMDAMHFSMTDDDYIIKPVD